MNSSTTVSLLGVSIQENVFIEHSLQLLIKYEDSQSFTNTGEVGDITCQLADRLSLLI